MLPDPTLRRPAISTTLAAASAAIQSVADRWRQRHGEAVCEVVPVVADGGRLRLEGIVLVPSQRAALLSAVAEATGLNAQVDIENAIETYTERDASQGWVVPAGDVLDVWAGPSREGTRATQLVGAARSEDLLARAKPLDEILVLADSPENPLARADPPARLLVSRGDWWALELADRTVGWSYASEFVAAPDSVVPASPSDWRAEYAGAWREPDPAAWREALAPWLGTPYVWGGTTRAGVDCSGLTQRLVRTVTGLGLPRHSSDQMAAGRRVARSDLRAGDLVFLTQKEGGVKHIGVVLDGLPLALGHASRGVGGVVEESLESVTSRYNFRAACRFGRPEEAI